MNRYDAQTRLHEIIEEIDDLAQEAKQIFREHFPDCAARGDAYGVFNLTASVNPYDTPLDSLVTDAFEEEYAD